MSKFPVWSIIYFVPSIKIKILPVSLSFLFLGVQSLHLHPHIHLHLHLFMLQPPLPLFMLQPPLLLLIPMAHPHTGLPLGLPDLPPPPPGHTLLLVPEMSFMRGKRLWRRPVAHPHTGLPLLRGMFGIDRLGSAPELHDEAKSHAGPWLAVVVVLKDCGHWTEGLIVFRASYSTHRPTRPQCSVLRLLRRSLLPSLLGSSWPPWRLPSGHWSDWPSARPRSRTANSEQTG